MNQDNGRIAAVFRRLAREGTKGFIPYLCAGDPDLDTTEQLVLALAESGADIIELGIPFSDPLADGPVIQLASQRALHAGTTPAAILELVQRLRRQTDVPLILMTYYNMVLQAGLETFARQARAAGVDGLIIPDIPLEESDPLFQAASSHDLDLIMLVTTTSLPERLANIIQRTRGFIYCVSVTGVTGARTQLDPGLNNWLEVLGQLSDIPRAVGFGISTPEQARAVAQHSEAVIVGSALVARIAEVGKEGAVAAAIEMARQFSEELRKR